jgi:hypothetical protein
VPALGSAEAVSSRDAQLVQTGIESRTIDRHGTAQIHQADEIV